ncbi:hypothetical protein SPRG_07909 [Saprolegnia parasitica CBS 223.65]|uniref:Nucleotide-diphospho-sugar transferase n=1 Tax=Saprolegnia parasitica (strain CBS 223.65) TaxID=695850 RepID=A0A067CIX1_SAPPC|nr:hypothetical protein SPRG_07909 [Saprolegnia parasitica CBS 223.65]KDO26506.1 hypothetical protein SPRG_07909 [Saprolegnia parasitica CBS 223.65]|eukprot:XP_012202651.1 hypothetical protein SPRG_07909 [Saprolegnia parasitica CBS 223.65]
MQQQQRGPPPSVRWRRRGSAAASIACLLATIAVATYTTGVFHVALPTPSIDEPRNLTLDRVPAVWQPSEFECVAWRAMSDCDPVSGQRRPLSDQSCDAPIVTGLAGYCEVRNRTSGDTYRVMATTCHSIERGVNFTCSMARAFTDFRHRAAAYEHAPSIAGTASRGLVFAIYPAVVPSVSAIIQLLRSYGCRLPIELFYRHDEMDPRRNAVLQRLEQTDKVVLRAITDPRATRFRTKPYALYHASFDHVLLLDCDNLPLRDPTYLFESRAFETHGALFWPDYWQPSNTLFHVDGESLLWEYLGVAFPTGMFEQESGQVLLNRATSVRALQYLMALTFHPNVLDDLKLAYGDKDLFRLAFLATSTPFHYIAALPMIVGTQLPWRAHFCGIAMGQRDMHGDMIFLHRNSAKLSGDAYQVPLLTHLQRFDQGRSSATKYKVAWTGDLEPGTPCWSLPWLLAPSSVEALSPTHPVVQAERKAIAFAVAAGNLLLGARQAPIADRPMTVNAWTSWLLALAALLYVVFAMRQLPSTWLHGSKKKRKTSSLVVNDCV